ncbi:MAG: protease SohB [Pseudomonadales bacterium]
MLELFAEYGLFLAKVVTIAVAIMFVIATAASAAQRGKPSQDGHIEVRNLNSRYNDMRDTLRHAILSEPEFKAEEKRREKAQKKKLKEEKKALKNAEKKVGDAVETDDALPANGSTKKRVFVLSFNGDMQASAVDRLREEISSVLSLAKQEDEIVLVLESPGGVVHGYGLASSQLERIKQRNVPLTVCVDKVAASGGYMMACLADKIVAAPFAVLGSIGVVAQVPNFHRLLQKNEVDVEILTAGEYKRTLTLFGENTEKGREKFKQDLEETHVLFKEWVAEHRPQLDIDKVATGETWYGKRAIDLQLADQLSTSDDYLFAQVEDADLYQVRYEEKKSLQQRFGMAATNSVDGLLLRWWSRLQGTRWF